MCSLKPCPLKTLTINQNSLSKFSILKHSISNNIWCTREMFSYSFGPHVGGGGGVRAVKHNFFTCFKLNGSLYIYPRSTHWPTLWSVRIMLLYLKVVQGSRIVYTSITTRSNIYLSNCLISNISIISTWGTSRVLWCLKKKHL